MLTLNDGRAELWQWDTGRTLAVDSDCSQVHFSNKVFGRSIDVDVVDGVAIIPDVLLQTDKDLNVWAFVGTAENGYTKISKTFRVNRRNKPDDYVFTPVEQTTIAEIYAIAQSVRDDADAGLFDGKPGENGRDGVDGKDGAPGKDGTSATHSWNGTVLTITSASGTSSSDLKGDKGDKGDTGPAGKDGTPGADGKTPEYGVDYGTPEQIAGIAQHAAGILQPDVNQIKEDIADNRETLIQINKSCTKNTNDISFLKNGNITKKVNNIVTNGNFVGTSNWTPIYSTVSASNNILSITGNGGNARAIVQISQTIQFDESMRIFACAKVRVTNDACEFLTITTAGGYYQTKIVKPVKDKWYTIAVLQDSKRTGNFNLMYFDHAYSDATTANGKVMEIKEVIAFDAMEVFSEYPPMYKLLNIINYNSWWRGEKEVVVEKVHETERINNANNGYLLPVRNAYHAVKRPIVTFINDDGWQDDYNKLVAISEKHQVPFVSALFNGSTMGEWYELYLQNELGWEFASHPRNTALAELETEEDIENAMIETNEYLTNRGLIYHNLVYPYGSNDESVRRIAKKYYRCACTTDSNGLNKDVVSSFTLHRYPLGYGGTSETNTLENLKAKVDEAVVNNSWLIFMLHPHMAEHTDAITQMIDDLITYIKSINVDILTLNEGYNIFGNALECSDFTGGETGFAIGFDGARKNI